MTVRRFSYLEAQEPVSPPTDVLDREVRSEAFPL